MSADVTCTQSIRVGINSKSPFWAVEHVEVEIRGARTVRRILPSHNKWMRNGHDAVDRHGQAVMCAS